MELKADEFLDMTPEKALKKMEDFLSIHNTTITSTNFTTEKKLEITKDRVGRILGLLHWAANDALEARRDIEALERVVERNGKQKLEMIERLENVHGELGSLVEDSQEDSDTREAHPDGPR